MDPTRASVALGTPQATLNNSENMTKKYDKEGGTESMKKIALILAVVCVVAIVAGCGGGDEPAAPQAAQATVETTPAMSSQEARAEFLRLYDALQGFRNDRQFKEVGFGTCCKYHQWIVDMKKLHNGPSSKVLFDEYQVMTGDLMTLGMEYAIKKGETKDSQYFESQLAGFVNNR